MEVNTMFRIKADIKRIEKFFDKENDSYMCNAKDSSCDKYGRGFNKDSRFSATGDTHKVSYDSWKGYFGDSNCRNQLNINSKELFWKCFDEYLNEHQAEIMLAIADKMKKELSANTNVLVKEIQRLQETLVQINDEKED